MVSRLLFWLTIMAAGGLAAGVIIAPLLEQAGQAGGSGTRLITLFASDTTVRRTALASSIGLVATARVFFRSKKPAK